MRRIRRSSKASARRVVLDARIERIVNESGARDRFVIIFSDQREAPADELQPARGRMIVYLPLNVRCLNDAGHLYQYRIAGEPFVHERGKRTQTLRILVRVPRA